jgi:ATP-dependent RNA helicase RhlE
MFSATYSEEIRELAQRFLRNPATVEVAARNATAERVDQTVYRVSKDHKRHLLAHLIDSGNWHQVLVFTRTKHGANRLAQQLEGSGIRSAAIHGNKSQGARVRALADFKENRVTALVATEVAARGLDIKELPHVVNYELPNVPEDYVHRIGRTARAGGAGSAVSLVAPDEAPLLRDIERLLRRSLLVAQLPDFPIKAAPAGSNALATDRRPPQGNERGGRRDEGRRSSHGREQHNTRGRGEGQGGNEQRGAHNNEQRHSHEPRRSHGQEQRHSHSHGYGHGRPGNSGNGNAQRRDRSHGPRRTGSY